MFDFLRSMSQEQVYEVAGYWLRSLARGSDVCPEEKRETFNRLTREAVRVLVASGLDPDRLASQSSDFPCIGCPAPSYLDGPHKFGCGWKGARALKMNVVKGK